MGARTDFVKAMLVGVVIGVAITTAFFQLRGGPSTTAASSKPIGSAGSSALAGGSSTPSSNAKPLPPDAAARARELAQLRARIAELERGATSTAVVDAEHGMSTDDAWWAKLPPNPAWDEPREKAVIERVAKLGVRLGPDQVECKTRCCRLAIDDETYEAHEDELHSSVGLAFEPPGGMGTTKAGSVYVVTKCWSTNPVDKPIPDRAVERDALLAKAKAELDNCGQGTSPTITLELGLLVDEQGQISKVDSNAAQLGQKAATCAETALLQAASFAASPMSTYVPITVVLGK